MSALVQYDTMRGEVQKAETIDEAATIRDQAEALRAYAKQRHDPDLEMWMGEIKVRAVARIGQLSRELDTSKGGSNPLATLPIDGKSKSAVLAEAGISTSAAGRYEEAASVPPTAAERYYRDSKATGKPPTVKGLRAVLKKEKRAEKEIALGQQQASAPPAAKRYGVIYADPPWRFEPYSRDTGMDRAADNQYPTMNTAELCALEIPAAEDCALFLWATMPMLPQALTVMSAWGFQYKSGCVWVKDRLGTGYWFRNKHELLLVGTRGDIPAPAPGTQFASVIEAAVGAHSAKPNAFAEMIEEIFPTLPALEIFARSPRAGWTVWGNEAVPQEVRGQAVA
jgi:N6-adenosine-specific RNA methylase IME4